MASPNAVWAKIRLIVVFMMGYSPYLGRDARKVAEHDSGSFDHPVAALPLPLIAQPLVKLSMPESAMLPDREIEVLLPKIRERWWAEITGRCSRALERGSFLESSWEALFASAMREMEADEGTVWLLDDKGEALVPVHNSGPRARDFVAKFRQPLSKGLISAVFGTQIGMVEDFVYRNAEHDPQANQVTGVVTVHLGAVPFYFGGDTRGVVTAVKIREMGTGEADDPPPFVPEALGCLSRLANHLGELVDGRCLRLALNV